MKVMVGECDSLLIFYWLVEINNTEKVIAEMSERAFSLRQMSAFCSCMRPPRAQKDNAVV